MRKSIWGLLLVGLAIVSKPAAPQSAAGDAQPASTFRTGVRLIEVDVVAKKGGHPAAGLTKDDFVLLDNGRPQKIALFLINAGPRKEASLAPLASGAVSNRIGDDDTAASATVLLIDQKNTPWDLQAFAIARIGKFVRFQHRRGRVGIYTLAGNGSVHVVQELTGDEALLRRAAERLKSGGKDQPDKDTGGMTAHAAREYTATRMMDAGSTMRGALEAIARHLATVPGRKTLVWITTGFQFSAALQPDMEKAARALNDANAALYAVDPRGLAGALAGTTAISSAEFKGTAHRAFMPRGGFLPGTETMSFLAHLTGGLLFENDNGIEDLIQTAIDDSALTYTLGFYPDQEEPDATWHKIKVEAKPRGISLRYRENYFAARSSDEASTRASLMDLLRASLDATQVRLMAEQRADPSRPGFVLVKVNVDAHQLSLEPANARRVGGIDISFYVQGSGEARTKSIRLDVPEDQLAEFLKQGVTVNASIAAPKGGQVLRVVVQDRGSGAAGSVTMLVGE